ncbi:MAG TPA: dihydrofolate reductase family protein [Vitreimonas sp.]|nr:dihydrofolate reductase family protein [Vitreimonas sp.]
MKIILYMATSIDGLIATEDSNSDWVSPSDVPIFTDKINTAGCVIMGKRTYDHYYGEMFPMANVLNVVISQTPHTSEHENVIYLTDYTQIKPQLSERGLQEAILIGGGVTNGLFINAGLIDEIFLSVHPLVLGKGIRLFENYAQQLPLKFLAAVPKESDLVQLHYQVQH